jgi:hypothetical protein
MRLKRLILCSLATATFVSAATTIELPVTFSKRCCADSSKELPDLSSSGGGGADVIPVTYEQVRPWAKKIREAVLKHRQLVGAFNIRKVDYRFLQALGSLPRLLFMPQVRQYGLYVKYIVAKKMAPPYMKASTVTGSYWPLRLGNPRFAAAN